MSNKGTFDYIGLWEQLNNENFNFTEFSEIKKNEAYQEKIEWHANRVLARTNYLVHTDAIKNYIVPLLTEKQKQYII